jgi:dinuclear metal center YbgI/SA1388 family protein
MKLDDLTGWFDELLEPGRFSDYCHNGLQIEGCADVQRMVTGVSVSQALIDAAIECDAQAIFVHHGLFWKNQWPLRVRGSMRRRLRALLSHDLSLFAYHLPLDAHPVVGNNAMLAMHLGLVDVRPFGNYNRSCIGAAGALPEPQSVAELTRSIGAMLGRDPLVLSGDRGPIRTIGIISGGAGHDFQQAIDQGLDAYLTGEPSEPALMLAREEGATFFAGGHYLTERFGVQAVGERLAVEHGVDVRFVELPNPV